SLLWQGQTAAATELHRRLRATFAPVLEVEMQARLGMGRLAAELALANDDLPGAWREARGILREKLQPLPGYAEPYIWVAARVVAAIHARPHAVTDGVRAEVEAAVPEFRALLERL